MDCAVASSRSSFDLDMIPSIPSQHIVPQTAIPMSARRRRRNSSVSAGLRRSASTPNVRSLASGNPNMSAADRRGGRNKLGYHRTSIACGHCRRRKIRCIPAGDDPQQRCQNCIKLKKECSFLPVDHPPGKERRPRAGSRVEAKPGDASGSSSSSPPLIGGQLDFNHFPPPAITTTDFPLFSNALSAHTLSPNSQAQFSARPYDYYHHQDHGSWDSPFIDNGPLSAGNSTPEDPSQNHWRSPLTPAFPPQFSGPSTSSSGRESGGSFTSFPPVTNGLGFPVPIPARSMSVHGGQDFHRNYQNQFTSAYDSDSRRRASEMHPPSLQASHNSSNNSISEPSGTPLLGHPSKQWGIPPAWAPLPGQAQVKPPDISWYSPEPAGLAQVQEEEVPPAFGSPPVVMYSDGMHQ